jgi:hypothetical protein
MIRFMIGLCVIALGGFVALYFGAYLCFFGGIVDFISAIKTLVLSNPVSLESLDIVLLAGGIVKVAISAFVFWLSFAIFLIPGFSIIICPN